MGGSSSPWLAVILAALGSSAVGAILGGYLTTLTRGRIEREEAWRTRLIGAVDDLNLAIVTALRGIGSYLPGLAGGESYRDANGTMSTQVRERIGTSRSQLEQVEPHLARVELLFGADSPVYKDALHGMKLANQALNILEKSPKGQALVTAVHHARDDLEAALAEVLAGPHADLFWLLPWMSGRDEGTPEGCDLDDDQEVAQWARLAHRAAGTATHDFIEAAGVRVRAKGSALMTDSAEGSSRPGWW